MKTTLIWFTTKYFDVYVYQCSCADWFSPIGMACMKNKFKKY